MRENDLKILVIAVLAVSFAVFYWFPVGIEETDTVFLSISSFLFAIFAGFFITKQSQRYQQIRASIAEFDGNMSAIYRASQHFGHKIQGKTREIIKDHYKKILKSHKWDYYFTHKSTTLTDLHTLLDEELDREKGVSVVRRYAVRSIMVALEKCQVLRKNMISLHLERIPHFQLILIYFLTAVVLLSIATIPTQFFFFGALLKAAFVTSVIVVVVLLHLLDRLALFEGMIGENSAQDVLEIIQGRK